MPSAVLRIDADTSGLARALGDARAQAAATEKAVGSAFTRAGRAATASGEAMARAQQRAEAAAVRAARAQENAQRRAASEAERSAQRSAMAYTRAEDQKRRASRMSAQAAARAEREATQIAQQEARKRGLTAEQEARVKQQTLERLTRTYEAEERRQTAIARREEAARTRDARREATERRRATRETNALGRTIGRGISQTGSALATGARATHSQIQDARQNRAVSERTLSQAVRALGFSEADVAATRTRVRQFVEQTGMSFADVSQALNIGQARGSSLEAQGGESRMAAVERALSIVREANAEGADPGQYLAARGRLQASGLRGDALKGATRFALAAAQAGQVEVDQIIQQGLPGASRLMADRAGALTRNTGESDTSFEERRQRVMLHAFRESVATQEVLAASGGRAGYTANTLASLQNFMNTPRRQEMALTNIRAAEAQVNQTTPEGRARAAALRSLYEGENAMFERDPTRRGNAMRLREGVSPIEFATRVASATGNAQAGANIFAGGGHGNAQAFLSNMRNLMAVLGGERGQAVQRMMASTGVTDETVRRHTAGVEGDTLAEMTRAQEKGANALTDNTNALVELSNRISTWSASNPFASTALSVGGGLFSSVLGGALANRVGGAFAGSSIGRAITGGGGVGGALAAARTGASGLLGRAGRAFFGVPGMLYEGLSAVGAYGGTSQEDVARQRREGAEWERQSVRLNAAAAAAHRPPPTAAEIGSAVADALRSNPPTISPTDAAQAAARAAPPGR